MVVRGSAHHEPSPVGPACRVRRECLAAIARRCARRQAGSFRRTAAANNAMTSKAAKAEWPTRVSRHAAFTLPQYMEPIRGVKLRVVPAA
jgi:hypothetical protein